jgi:hypothetical protein
MYTLDVWTLRLNNVHHMYEEVLQKIWECTTVWPRRTDFSQLPSSVISTV